MYISVVIDSLLLTMHHHLTQLILKCFQRLPQLLSIAFNAFQLLLFTALGLAPVLESKVEYTLILLQLIIEIR